jgi:acyl-CoA thioesterase FadM
MDDVIGVETSLIEARGASLVLAQHGLRGEEMLVEARVTVVSLSGGRPVRLPRPILRALHARMAK